MYVCRIVCRCVGQKKEPRNSRGRMTDDIPRGIQRQQNGVGQQPSHEHGAEATAPCDRQVMASDGVFT